MTGLPPDGWVVLPVRDANLERGAPPDAAGAELPILVALAPDLAGEAADASEEVGYLLSHAANIFELLHDVTTHGSVATDAGLASLAEVCGRAFRDMARKEGEVLSRVAGAIRGPLAAHHQSRREADRWRREQEEARRAAQP